MQIRSKWLLPFCVILVVATGIAALWWRSNAKAGHWWHQHGTNVLTFVIPPMIAALAWAFKEMIGSRPERSTPEQLSAAEQDLAARGLEWWRGVLQPAWPGHVLRAGLQPLDVKWAQPSDHEPPEDGPVYGSSGHIADLVDTFRATRPCRLVISGRARSGKSVLARMMMVEMLKDPKPGDPVPVFLPLWSWSPQDERFHEWMKGQVSRAYPELQDEATYGPTAVANLVDQGRVLPILDGLDALPKRARKAVMRDGELMSQDRLIVTCRKKYFDDVNGFIIIEPRPVGESEAFRFLVEVTGLKASSFSDLRDQLSDDLRDQLSDPRMIYLTSIVYGNENDNSSVSDGTLPTEPAPEDNDSVRGAEVKPFLGRLVNALMLAPDYGVKKFPWYAARAEEWLSRLAGRDLRDPGNRNYEFDPNEPGDSRIAWWNLHRGLPWLRDHQAFFRSITIGFIAFVVITFVFRAHRSWHYSLLTAGAYGVMIVIAGTFLGQEVAPANPDRYDHLKIPLWWLSNTWSHWRREIVAGTLGFVFFGLLIGIRVGLLSGPDVGFRTAFWDGLLQGCLIVILTFFIAEVPTPPRTALSVDRGIVPHYNFYTFVRAMILGIPFGLLWGISAVIKHQQQVVPTIHEAILTGLITGINFALGAWSFGWARAQFRSTRAPNPRFASRLDIAGTVVCALILGVTFGFAFGVSAPFNFTGADVVAWFVVGVAIGILGSEWQLYAAAIAWLAVVKKELPLRLMRFLEYCRTHDIVGAVGQEYQFNDDELLKYLSAVSAQRHPSAATGGEDRPRPYEASLGRLGGAGVGALPAAENMTRTDSPSLLEGREAQN